MLFRNGLRVLMSPAIRTFKSMEELIQKHQIIPDVITKEPLRICDIYYQNTRAKVNLGNVLTPKKTSHEPCVKWISDMERYYTIIMIDPDMPHRSTPTMREFVHWVVGNIPGPKVEQGKILVEYVGACPPQHSGLHRYVFLIYRQEEVIVFEDKCLTTKMGPGRAHFNTTEFVKKYNLIGPLEINYFLAEFDNFVPVMYTHMNLTNLIAKPKSRGY